MPMMPKTLSAIMIQRATETGIQQLPPPSKRPSSSALGYGRRWQKIRRMFLRRNPWCVHCKAEGRHTLATEVDHITPKRLGGGDEDNNLQALCNSCHSKKTYRENHSAAK